MLREFACTGLFAASILLAGCTDTYDERNAFLTYTETFGSLTAGSTDEDDGAGGTAADIVFRRNMNIELANNHPDADLSVNFAAWVKVSSLRSADQQDELFRSGYVELSREVRLGRLVLPPGTFVRNGPGVAGGQRVLIPSGESRVIVGDRFVDPADVPTDDAGVSQEGIVTPDVILAYLSPPNNCDDAGFQFLRDGRPLGEVGVEGSEGLIFGGSSTTGGMKTLEQYGGYRCAEIDEDTGQIEFKPGLYFRLGGGQIESNEFFEGQNVRFDFNADPDADGNFAIVTIE